MLLKIGNGSKWCFAHGLWQDGENQSLQPLDNPRDNCSQGMQGYRFAFLIDRIYKNINVKFQIFQSNLHNDVGFIFHAQNKSKFYLLHFPSCGQASRAQHFWAAVSQIDESGFLRIKKLQLINRVPSNVNSWHDIDLEIAGKNLSVRIDKVGGFKMSIPDFEEGRIGLFLFNNNSGLKNVDVQGKEYPAPEWDESIEQPTNWFYPYDNDKYGRWQRPQTLLKKTGGELLLFFDVMEKFFKGKTTSLVTQSSDLGLTWSETAAFDIPYNYEDGYMGKPHVFPDGKIKLISASKKQFYLQEIADSRIISSERRPIDINPWPKKNNLHMGPQVFVNTAEGKTIMFLYGRNESTPPDASIYTWSSHHCQAFTCYSLDSGITWSPLINIDGMTDPEGNPVDGNMDLTEVCGVEAAKNEILALVRPIYSPWMWETWSKDGGITWGPCVRGPFPGYAAPNMLKTSSGIILVAHRLPELTIHSSHDIGRTWDNGTVIDSAIWVMGSMIEIKPDIILYVYYDSFEGKMRAQYIKAADDGIHPVQKETISDER